MADDLKMEKPELTLETPVMEMEQAEPTLEIPKMDSVMSKEDAETFRLENFSEEEKKQINNFADEIDLHDTNIIISYGAGAQKRLADFSDSALEQVRNKDLDEVGGMISDLVADLKFDPDEDEGFFAKLFHRGANKAENVKEYYNKVSKSVEKVAANLEGHQQTLLKDIAIQDMLFENNKTFFKELTMYIAAGKIALDKAQNEELPAMKARAAETGLSEDAQAVSDYASMCERFEKRLHDLELTRTICLQNAPQIRLIQNNAMLLSDKIHTTIVNTIPLWKNQMIITLGLEHSKEAVEAQNMVTNTTNDLLKKNAELLHQTTVDIAKENERGIVDIETLQHTNNELINTLDDIMKVQQEGREKRKAAETELANIEAQLKAKMLEMSR
ncbi:MAG: toxic anion resistance protein [Bacillota bacterium]|nr:toxic anion resistance protein [Bacillota bacterium]